MNETSDNPNPHKPTPHSPSVKAPKSKPVKVGFDLDGVLFFNPLRVVRRPIEIIKKYILKKDIVDFYVPKTKVEKFMWRIVHMSSLSPASGWEKIRELALAGHIEPYLITARFACLKKDFDACKSKIDADKYFIGTYNNEKDEQPHLFKERMVKELEIEYYIEDNWNIVNHLSQKTNTKVLWVSNIADQDIQFDEKFGNLSSALVRLSELVK